MGLAATRRDLRADLVNEAALAIPAVAFFVIVSSQTSLCYGRYALPVYPYLFILAGRLGQPLVSGGRVWSVVIGAAIVWAAAAPIAAHPYPLTYFNEAAGGPKHGIDHLVDSSLDWGQGLIAFREWLEQHAPGRSVLFAYFGKMSPDVLGIRYQLPPFGVSVNSRANPNDAYPLPGLQAVSATYLAGVPFDAPAGNGTGVRLPVGAYRYYRRFKPIAVVANSIYIYDISSADVDRARRDLGHGEFGAPAADSGR